MDLHEETVGMGLGSTYLKRLRTKPIEIFGIRFRIYCKKLQIGTKGRSNLVQLCFFTPYFYGGKVPGTGFHADDVSHPMAGPNKLYHGVLGKN